MAELELQAVLIQQFALTLVPGLLQTNDYARALPIAELLKLD